MLNIALPIIIGYFIGSIPFGLIAGKIKGIDIRQKGSGNIGATNIYRTLGTFPALTVFALDLFKGTAAVLIASYFYPTPLIMIISGIASIIGHMFSVFLGFKGGKGAATGLGVLLGITPDLFAVAIIYMVLCIAVTRYVSVTSMSGVILLAILMFVFNKPLPYAIATVMVALLMIYKHIPNIQRLMAGTEPKIWGRAYRQAGNK